MGTLVLPGVYITVRDEGLISVSGVSVGTVGIIGMAKGGEANKPYVLSNFTDAKAVFGTPQSTIDAAQNKVDTATKSQEVKDAKTELKNLLAQRYQNDLLNALELVFANGGHSVYAVKVAADNTDSFGQALATLENELVNVITIAGKDATHIEVMAKLKAHLQLTSTIRRERIGVVGCGAELTQAQVIAGKDSVVDDSGRLVYVAPGITTTGGTVLSGARMSAAITGLIAGLPVRTSPTNKVVNFGGQLSDNYNFAQLEALVKSNILVVERREGFRVVKGVTSSSNPSWRQITTRRIVDKAIYGVRSACNSYIGKLNNTRVRSAMRATIDGFLTRMVEEESLTDYELDVSATRPQEISGIAAVNLLVKPTFSIDYVQVTMTLG
jgi:hypothetical protein